MGCVLIKCLKLANSRLYLIWARMNYFEMCLMVLAQKVDSKLLRMASLSILMWQEAIVAKGTPNEAFQRYNTANVFAAVWLRKFDSRACETHTYAAMKESYIKGSQLGVFIIGHSVLLPWIQTSLS